MPDIHDTDTRNEKKRQFMREKIGKPPLTRGQMVRRMVTIFFIAVFFGVAAGVSFAVTKPLAEKYLLPKPVEETMPITIPKDDPEIVEETVAVENNETIAETEPIEDMLQNAMEQYQYNISDLMAMHANLRSVAQAAEKSIVEVHSVKQEMDLFDNPVESTGVYAGIVISVTPQEILVLAPDKAVENADSIKVTFNDRAVVNGVIKQRDSIIGMTIVSVDHTQLEDDVLESITAVQLGNSYSVKQGDLIIAVGAPAGLVHSACYGEISYILRNYPRVDGISRLFYTDVQSNPNTGTFLLNTEGQIVGWITNIYHDEIDSDLPIAIAVSEYKGILEQLSNGVSASYFGIKGQEVNEEIAGEGVPTGVYVTAAVTDGPAYNAGIQNGDIITKIGDQDISVMKDLQTAIEGLTVGQEVPVMVQRYGVDTYKELEYRVVIGSR